MNRPIGVIILAVLDWIGAACLFLVGIALAVGMSLVGFSSGKAGLLALGAMGGVFLIVFAVIAAFIGFGLWSLKNWARIVTIVLCALGLVAAIPALLMFTGMHGPRIVVVLIRMGVNVLVIWYLLQPHVKQAFAAAV